MGRPRAVTALCGQRHIPSAFGVSAFLSVERGDLSGIDTLWFRVMGVGSRKASLSPKLPPLLSGIRASGLHSGALSVTLYPYRLLLHILRRKWSRSFFSGVLGGFSRDRCEGCSCHWS